jgi:hypothetical protein
MLLGFSTDNFNFQFPTPNTFDWRQLSGGSNWIQNVSSSAQGGIILFSLVGSIQHNTQKFLRLRSAKV